MKETLLRHADLQFHSNAILTRGMLLELRDYPALFTKLIWQDYSDGIISGFDFRQKASEIILTPGLVLFGREFYFLTEEVSLTALADKYRHGRESDLKSAFFRLLPSNSFKDDGVEIKTLTLDIGPEIDHGIFLAAFSPQVSPQLPEPGAAKLFEEYTAPSRLQVLECQYAGKGETTFHPLVFEGMSCALTSKERKSAADWALLLMLQNNPVASLASLATYVRGAGIAWPENKDRREMFKKVCEAIATKPPVPVAVTPEAARMDKPAPELTIPKVIR